MTTIVTIDMGGTGATHAAGAREALSVPSMTDMGQSYAQANSARDQANTARDQANTARDTSNNAYAQANTGRSDANTTFASINTTFETVNTSLSTMNINLSSAQTWANIVSFAAYGQANTARGTANDAYAQANAGYIQANAAYGAANTRLSASGGTLSGDLIITGNLTVSGNQTILNTEVLTTEDADIILLSNTSSTPALNAGLIINRGTSTNTFLRWDEALDEWGWSDSGNTTYYFEDLRQGLSTTNTTFSTINTSLGTINTNYQAAYAQANDARGQANTAYGQANAAYGQANAAYGQANAAYGQANDAYTRANTKLDSAGGTISGNLTVTGTLTVSGNVSSINTQSISSVSNEIILNSNASGAPTLDGKLTVNRGSSSNVTLLWNETADKWGWTDNGTTYYYFDDIRAGYAQANAGYAQANSAYAQANAAYGQANSAYGAANNRVLKAGDTMTGQLNISSGGLLVTGDVGFGSSPAFTSGSGLEIQRATATATLRLDSSSFATELYGYTGGTGLFQLSAGYLDLGTNNTTRLRITSDGNIGIATTDPNNARLHITGVGTGPDLGTTAVSNATAVFSNSDRDYGMYFAVAGNGDGAIQQRRGATAVYYNLLLQPHGGNVAIGATSAGAKLAVTGEVRIISSGAINTHLNYNDGGDNYISMGNAGATYFRNSSTTLMTILGSGAVGVGVASPGQKLDVGARIKFRSDGSASAGIWLTDSSGNENVFMGLQGTSSTDSWGVFSNSGWRLTLLNGGNFGVGTASPATKLHVSGSTRIDHSVGNSSLEDGNGLQINGAYTNGQYSHRLRKWDDSGGVPLYVQFTSGTANTWANIAKFGPNTADDAYLTVYGKMSVTGTAALRNGIQFFRVNSASTGLSFYNSTYSAWCVYMAATGVGSCGPHGNFTSPGSGHGVTSWALRSFIENSSGYGFTWETGTSTGNPTVIAGLEASTGNFSVAGTVTANSDERVKKNIKRIDNALDKVKNIDGVYFEKIDTEEKSVGVIAQQVEKVLPEVVKLGDPNDPDSIKSVAYGNMVGLLIEAIKEQQKQIEELKVKVGL